MENGLLTIKQLAERLQVHAETVRELYRKGVIPGLKLGHRTLRFDFAEVIARLRRIGP